MEGEFLEVPQFMHFVYNLVLVLPMMLQRYEMSYQITPTLATSLLSFLKKLKAYFFIKAYLQ